jgi:hypothetical protein
MAVRVLSDNLPNRAAGAAAQEAVLEAIGAPDGDFKQMRAEKGKYGHMRTNMRPQR